MLAMLAMLFWRTCEVRTEVRALSNSAQFESKHPNERYPTTSPTPSQSEEKNLKFGGGGSIYLVRSLCGENYSCVEFVMVYSGFGLTDKVIPSFVQQCAISAAAYLLGHKFKVKIIVI